MRFPWDPPIGPNEVNQEEKSKREALQKQKDSDNLNEYNVKKLSLDEATVRENTKIKQSANEVLMNADKQETVRQQSRNELFKDREMHETKRLKQMQDFTLESKAEDHSYKLQSSEIASKDKQIANAFALEKEKLALVSSKQQAEQKSALIQTGGSVLNSIFGNFVKLKQLEKLSES